MATNAPAAARPLWLVVPGDAALGSLAAHAPDADVRFLEPDDLAERLATSHPRLVVVADPPATAADLDAVAASRRRNRDLRTVLLAPPDAVGVRISALQADFDDALPSTIDIGELAVRLRRLVARAADRPRSAAGRRAIAIAEGVELDLQACELRKYGQPHRLRPRELQLLTLLATHPRRAYSRQELIDRIWGAGFHGDPRTIDVHLRWLRSKVEADPEHPIHLVTVRGRGYRFDPPEASF
jgi:DNA-binding response OmpR family regulator